ncbi:MAG: transcriptional regulator [Anaerovoracaceae bacterium]
MDKTQKQVLDFLMRTAEGISQMFCHSCETLIHDMSRPGHPVIAIFNGHVSGRQEGSTADIFGDDSAAQGDTGHFKLEKDIINSLAVTKNGRYIKSTTLNFIGENYHYALGINFDYTFLSSAMSTLEGLVSIDNDLNHAISDSSNAQLEEIFKDCLSIIGKPVESMKKNDRVQLIALLMQRNAFSFQKSITYVAEQLQVSRYTIYKYCHEVEANLK